MPPRKRKVAPSESESGETHSGVMGAGEKVVVLDSGVAVTTGRTARKRRPPAKMLDVIDDASSVTVS